MTGDVSPDFLPGNNVTRGRSYQQIGRDYQAAAAARLYMTRDRRGSADGYLVGELDR